MPHPYREPARVPVDEPVGGGTTALSTLAVVVRVSAALLLAGIGCTPGQREDAATVLEISKTLCFIAHQALPDTEVAQICGVVGPLLGPMHDVLASSRAASAQAAAGARSAVCASDAGADVTPR